jgi:hypothetical protein
MANVFGNANPVATAFTGIGRKVRVINHIVDRLVPSEVEQRTDVIGRPRENLDRDGTIKGLRRCVVEKETDIHHA